MVGRISLERFGHPIFGVLVLHDSGLGCRLAEVEKVTPGNWSINKLVTLLTKL